jgi:hypothetical protein
MVTMTLKKDFDVSSLETGGLCFGYKKIKLLFNIGPFPKGLGEHCVIVEADGKVMAVGSCDLIHDLEAYQLSRE